MQQEKIIVCCTIIYANIADALKKRNFIIMKRG